MAPTGVAAQNVSGITIHSALRLTQSGSGYQSLAFHDFEFKKRLQAIQILIIDEISMVSALLFNFISDLFARIHNSDIAFIWRYQCNSCWRFGTAPSSKR